MKRIILLLFCLCLFVGCTSNKSNTDQAVDESSYMNKEEIDMLVIKTGQHTLYAQWENNSSAEALKEKLKESDLTLHLDDYGHFEKVGSLPWSLPRNDTSITTEPGDVILYQGSELTIYYDQNSWRFTRLAKIQDVSQKELKKILGKGSVDVTLSLSK